MLHSHPLDKLDKQALQKSSLPWLKPYSTLKWGPICGLLKQRSPTFFILRNGWGRRGTPPVLVHMHKQQSGASTGVLMHMRKWWSSTSAGARALMHVYKRRHSTCVGVHALMCMRKRQHGAHMGTLDRMRRHQQAVWGCVRVGGGWEVCLRGPVQLRPRTSTRPRTGGWGLLY